MITCTTEEDKDEWSHRVFRFARRSVYGDLASTLVPPNVVDKERLKMKILNRSLPLHNTHKISHKPQIGYLHSTIPLTNSRIILLVLYLGCRGFGGFRTIASGGVTFNAELSHHELHGWRRQERDCICVDLARSRENCIWICTWDALGL
jgi:hypothetical protein